MSISTADRRQQQRRAWAVPDRGTVFHQARRIRLLLLAALVLVLSTVIAPAAVQAQGIAQVAVTGVDGVLLRNTPAGTVSGIVSAGQPVDAVGRSADGSWIVVHTSDGSTGWVAVEQLILFGIDRLPVHSTENAFPVGDAAPRAPGSPQKEVSKPVATTITTTAAVSETGAVAPTTTPITDNQAAEGTSPTTLTATVTVSNSRLNVRAGPGTGYALVAKAASGDTFPAVGHNGAGDWVQIALPITAQSAGAQGWVAARYVALSGSLTTLPVVATVDAVPVTPATENQPPATTIVTPIVTPIATDQSTVVNRATALTVADTGTGPGLSGTLVFQSSPGGMIYAYNLTSGQLWPLANGFDPAISPDGQTVAFVREGGENGVYLVNRDGSNVRRIFSGRTRLSSPKWSPDGQWILFTRSDEYSECVEAGRGGCVSIDALPPGLPTGDLVVSKDYEYNLARVDTNGANYRDIAALESARVADWNAAGIVYQSSAGLQITSDTAEATNRLLRFTPLQPPDEDPDWQPNGGQVLFVQHHGSHYEIWTMNPDGTAATPLTRPVTTLVDQMPNNVAPAWSPDGQQIVFLSNRAANNEAGAWRLWVMNADGTNQRALPIDVPIDYRYGNEQAVDWGE